MPENLNPLSQLEAFKKLAGGATLLTVNNRLSRNLHQEYAKHQQVSVWETPAITPWGVWLQEIAEKLYFSGKLRRQPMSKLQEGFLWDEVIESWNGGASAEQQLLRTGAAATSARQAWQLIHDWHLPLQQIEQSLKPESRLFSEWSVRFRQQCERHNLITVAELPSLITKLLENNAVPLPPEIILSGFDEYTESQQRLFKALTEAGCKLYQTVDNDASGTATVAACHDATAELEHAASWAVATLQKSPDARIGIVVVNLQQRLAATERIFRYHFHPDWLSTDDSDQQPVFNLSLGRPLSDEMMVSDALLLLKLCASKIDRHEISRLLNSRYLSGYQSEWVRRAMLDARLRRHGILACSLGDLIFYSGSEDDNEYSGCAELHAQLLQLEEQKGSRTLHYFHQWAAIFSQLLHTAGWPGNATLNSREFQVREQFRSLLEQFSQLTRIGGKTDLSTALRRLRLLTTETPFQKQGSNAAVQIMGLLEAGGQVYDHLWIAGMEMEQWPPAARPNPLLPYQLQKEHQLPHSSAERELIFAKRVTTRLMQSANSIIFSFPKHDGESELAPSPLIANLPVMQLENRLPGHPLFQKQSSTPMSAIEDLHLPAIPVPKQISGGTSLLKDQAVCPFRAAAKHRLKATTLEEPEPGIDPLTRGTLLHRCLEIFWTQVKTRANLISLSRDKLIQQIDAIVTQTVSEKVITRSGLSSRFVELERYRLQRLLAEWLQLEAERPDFKVLHCEEARTAELSGLQFNIRADRVDQLEDGTQAVIDYKTGKATKPKWENERLDEPQLPLYAVSSNEDISAAVLGYVRYGDCKFNGLAASADTLEKKLLYKGDWDQLQQQWRDSLNMLADEILGGLATPTPSKAACQYCEIAPFCRTEDDIASENTEEAK